MNQLDLVLREGLTESIFTDLTIEGFTQALERAKAQGKFCRVTVTDGNFETMYSVNPENVLYVRTYVTR